MRVWRVVAQVGGVAAAARAGVRVAARKLRRDRRTGDPFCVGGSVRGDCGEFSEGGRGLVSWPCLTRLSTRWVAVQFEVWFSGFQVRVAEGRG